MFCIKTMKKNLFLIFIIFILLAPASPILAQGTETSTDEGRALEIVYPVLRGEDGEELTLEPDTGLPDYVRYVFRFAIAVSGFLILSVMVWNGISYVLSAGSAEKLLNARNGIFASLFGTLILVSAFILFNSINPDLTKLSPIKDLKAVEPVITPGIYLCNYNPGNVQGLIRSYLDLDTDSDSLAGRVNAARKLRDIMSNDDGSCYRVKFSANINKDDLNFTKDNNEKLMFSIPKRIYKNPEDPNSKDDWEYNYGIIFHEEDDWKGKCFPNFLDTNYESRGDSVTSTPFSGLDKAKSVTLFEKPERVISSSNRGIILFQCLDHSTTKNCPSGLTGVGGELSFSIQNANSYKREVSRGDLGNLAGPTGAEGRTVSGSGGMGGGGSVTIFPDLSEEERLKGTRSVKIDPEDAYFAIMFSGENYQENSKTCEVISKNDNNLLDQPIGQCGKDCKKALSDSKEFLRDCIPCLKSMTVVKGNVIY